MASATNIPNYVYVSFIPFVLIFSWYGSSILSFLCLLPLFITVVWPWTTIHTHMHAESQRRHNKDEWHSSLEKYTSHFIWKVSKGLLKVLLCERWVWDGKEPQHIDPTLIAIIAFLSRSPGLLNRGPRGPDSLRLVPHSSVFSSTEWTSCTPSYIIIWRPLFFLRASQFRTQFSPSTVKGISWYSSTGCTYYFHRCFDSLAGVNMLHN